MLINISIRNIALIEQLEMDLAPGLNVMTGETGAGKSIIIDALNLVLGRRADKELIKTGAQKASVEAVFTTGPAIDSVLDGLGIEPESELTLSRELNANGRNVCRINGSLVNNAALQQLATLLVDIHGQHEHQSLFDRDMHIRILDEYGGKPIAKQKAGVQHLLGGLKKIEKQLDSLGGDDGSRERRMDLLRFQINEIEAASPQAGEYEQLAAKRNLLANSERIARAINTAYDNIYGDDGGVMAGLSAAAQEMSGITAFDPEYKQVQDSLNEIYYAAEAVSDHLRSLKEGHYYDPAELQAIEQRLDVLGMLAKKYGGSEERVLEYYEEICGELYELENAGEHVAQLSRERMDAAGALYDACVELSDLRRKVGKRFSGAVAEQLRELGMPGALFSLEYAPLPGKEQAATNTSLFSRNGLDSLEFMFSANAGEPVKPLSRIASGGEASRIMLALKGIAAELDSIDCLVFDEIDTGISGRMAHVVGRKMADISRARQVVCITHLAQIASMADVNYLIEKYTEQEKTYTTVNRLDSGQRLAEVARLLGGEGDSGHGLAHAKELCGQAEQYKQKLS